MLVIVPGAIPLDRKKFAHIKLPCGCNAQILNHSGIHKDRKIIVPLPPLANMYNASQPLPGSDVDYTEYSLYECMNCGLTVTVPDYWGYAFNPEFTTTTYGEMDTELRKHVNSDSNLHQLAGMSLAKLVAPKT